jgi:hypothetical protein
MTSSLRIGRRAVAGAAFICLAAFGTACGTSSGTTSGSSATPTKTATATPAASAETSPSAATPSPSTSPAASAGPAPCLSRYLAAKVGVSQGTAGSIYIAIDFTNLNNVTCTLYGYPGVSLAGGTPVTQIGLAAAESHVTARKLVTLAPGAVANALLQIGDAGNFPSATCHQVTADYLQVYPPNQTVPIYIKFSSQACSKPVRILTVSVVQPGSGSAS